MPRKSKLKTKQEKKEVKKIKELKPILSEEQITSLEGMIKKDNEKTNFSDQGGFLNLKKQEIEIPLSSTSLKKINPPQRIPIRLERDIITGAMSIENLNKNKEEENGFKYISENKKTDEPKYVKYEGTTSIVTPRKEFGNPLMKSPFERKEVKFEDSMQAKTPGQESLEKYSQVGKLEKDKRTTKNIFERKEIKYSPEKY
jgi:hypothetical protein